MHEVYGDLGLRQNIVERISSLRHEVAMIQAIVVTVKNGMASLMLALNQA